MYKKADLKKSAFLYFLKIQLFCKGFTLKKEYIIPNIYITLQPEEQEIVMPRHKAKTVQRLFLALGLRECTALVIREGRLLTPDQKINGEDRLIVKKVTSAG